MASKRLTKSNHLDNHKPALSSESAPNHARLKPSLPGKTDSYDLSFTDGDGSYAYAGSRNTNSNQYVLHFDPERKAFILDKIDSTFNMNVTRLPGSSDPARLSRQYPRLDSEAAAAPRAGAKKTTTSSKEAPAPSAAKSQPKQPKRKAEKKQQAKQVALSFPEPQKEKPKPKRDSFDEEEEEDDDDGGLLIEYPGVNTSAKQADFSPAFPPPRRFDDFMDQRDSEADDADGESDDEPDMDFKLPSPVNNHHAEPMEGVVVNTQEEAGDAVDDLEDELEKEMEEAFEDMENSQEETPNDDGGGGGDESEISEED
jgi:hypothetical protein